MIAWTKRFASLALLFSLVALQGCATVKTADARDPWESMNRSVFQFNDVVDTMAIKPAAQLYVKVLPSFVRKGVGNFLGNLGDVWSLANSALQLKGQATAPMWCCLCWGRPRCATPWPCPWTCRAMFRGSFRMRPPAML